MNNVKLKKIGSSITKSLSEIIAEDAKDSLLKSITITDTEVSNDLSFAKVFFTSLSDMNIDLLTKEINEASSFLRSQLASKIELRHTPALQFVYDESIEYGNRIEQILNKIKTEKK